MEHILIFDKIAGRGVDIDILDDGRVIYDQVNSNDFSNKF